MPEMETSEHEAAYHEMMAAESAAIESVLAELEGHGIDQATRDDVRSKLETPSTVQVIEHDFIIIRRADNGFDIRWEEKHQAA